MSKILNDLHADGIEIIVKQDDGDISVKGEYIVDVQYVKENGKYEDGQYLAGYRGLANKEDAEFLARAFIDGYKWGKS